MSNELETAGALIASCALIILVACVLENVKAWGKVKGVGDIAAGALLGATSVAQMFHPIEPYPGFIFDLRTVPIVLVGAFASWKAMILAAAMAASARFGIGGTGMWPGIAAVFIAAGMGLVWQLLRSRGYLRSKLSYLVLGGFTAVSISAGFMLPDPVRTWFFVNAAPILGIAYLTLVPCLAWIVDCGLLVDSVSKQATRDALARKDVELLSLPAFIKQMRLSAILGDNIGASAVLCIRIDNDAKRQVRLTKSGYDPLLHAVLLRLAAALPDIDVASSVNGNTLLVPLTMGQLKQLDQIRETIKACIHSAPFHRSRRDKFWVDYNLGILSPDAFEDGETLLPRRIAKCQVIERQPAPTRTASTPSLRQTLFAKRFERNENTDLLFLKAQLLMNDTA